MTLLNQDADRFPAPTIHGMLGDWAERTPNAIAIGAPGRALLSYRRLRNHVERVVQALRENGVTRNDRVALVLPEGPEMAVACLAVMAGASCAPLNPGYRAQEFEFYLSDLNARMVIVPAGTDSPARSVAQARGIPCLDLEPVSQEEAGIFTLSGHQGSSPASGGFAQPDDVALVLHTSGTTSRPKLVPLLHRNLCAAAHNIRVAVELTAADRCLNVMPLFHLHALSVLFATVAAGASMVCLPGFQAAKFFEWMDTFRPTWYSAAPTLHQLILEQAPANGEIIARCPLRVVRSTSSALPPKILAELEKLFRAPVIEAYAMTETPSQITSNPMPPRERKVGSSGLAIGVEVAIMDEEGKVLPPEEVGEIVIRGPTVLREYENNPAANESSFRDGWFRTGDRGYLDSAGYLFVEGRLKEIINRGGEKISPLEIEKVLLEHPAVAQAAAFAVPHVALGEDVGAAVVLRKGACATPRELLAFALKQLADFKIPRHLVILDQIPKGSTGKLQRIGLAEKLGLGTRNHARGTEKSTVTAPRTAIETTLTEIWTDILKTKPIDIRDNFFELGGDSLSAAQLLVQIEKTFGQVLPMATLIAEATIEQLANVIQYGAEAPRWSSLVELQPHGKPPPFFCVHGLGGEVLSFTELARHLAPDQPFYGFQTPKSNGVQEPFARLETLAAHYVDEMRSVQPEGPYYLGGYSMGGSVAFEMAQQLRDQGQQIALLAILDHGPVWRQTRRVAWWSPSFIATFLKNIPYWILDDVIRPDGSGSVFTRIRVKARLFKSRLRNLFKKTASETIKSEIEGMFDVSRIPEQFRLALEENYALELKYAPKVYPGLVTLFRARTRPFFDMNPYDLGWRKLAGGGLEIIRIPGNHASILKEPHVQVLAKRLKARLQKAQATNQPAKKQAVHAQLS
jgi:acyl-CoA synthetase (AMP-forming)/AMP-acid ligase II/thioesterase domain-containing protein/acyl carrier protein